MPRRRPWHRSSSDHGHGRGLGRRRAADSTALATFWISTCTDLTRFGHFLLLLHCHNLILQCSNTAPTYAIPFARRSHSEFENVSHSARKSRFQRARSEERRVGKECRYR